jgi:hypothetical protein
MGFETSGSLIVLDIERHGRASAIHLIAEHTACKQKPRVKPIRPSIRTICMHGLTRWRFKASNHR